MVLVYVHVNVFGSAVIYFDSFVVDLIEPCKILFSNFFQGWREVGSQNDLVICVMILINVIVL